METSSKPQINDIIVISELGTKDKCDIKHFFSIGTKCKILDIDNSRVLPIYLVRDLSNDKTQGILAKHFKVILKHS